MRTFDTGATRNVDTNKFDYEGFESPEVTREFAAYMHENRLQADGKLRDSDNWQKGIPKDAYMKSLLRHVMDVWFHHRGRPDLASEPLKKALCAVRFNNNGYLFEVLREARPQPFGPGPSFVAMPQGAIQGGGQYEACLATVGNPGEELRCMLPKGHIGDHALGVLRWSDA